MHRAFAFGFKETVGAVVLSCFIAGGVSAMSAPAILDSNHTAISVNRADKGDRLLQGSGNRQGPAASNTTPASSTRVPLGCDPVFSPVADPARGRIFRRCMT